MARVSFHLLFPTDHPPQKVSIVDPVLHIDYSCSMNTIKVLDFMFKSPAIEMATYQEWRRSYAYPQNLARNVARKGTNTPYTFVTDIDIVSLF